MLEALAILLVFQLLGEALVQLLDLPVPGPVVGLVLLWALLSLRRRIPNNLQTTVPALLSHLSLLFVPAGVGVMLHGERIREQWLAIGVALILSTLMTIVVTVMVTAALSRSTD